MTDAELAQWQYAHRDELEAEEGEPVHAEISPQLSVTLSFRVPGSEADAIREAAHEAGMSMSEWIRQACALAAAPDTAAAQAREARDALDEAGRSIQEAKRRMASEPVRAAPKKTVKEATAEKSTKKAATKSAGKTAAKKSGKKAAKKSTRRAR